MGEAIRHVKAKVEKNAVFYYYPQPVIPYAQSAFDSTMEFDLADESSGLFLLEIISCGRKASAERFLYRKFASRVNIRRAGRLIYRDNTRYEPDKMDMEGLGMYEGYTHMANIFLSGPVCDMQEKIWEVLENEKECARRCNTAGSWRSCCPYSGTSGTEAAGNSRGNKGDF